MNLIATLRPSHDFLVGKRGSHPATPLPCCLTVLPSASASQGSFKAMAYQWFIILPSHSHLFFKTFPIDEALQSCVGAQRGLGREQWVWERGLVILWGPFSPPSLGGNDITAIAGAL